MVGAPKGSTGSAATQECDETSPLPVWPQTELPLWDKSMGSWSMESLGLPDCSRLALRTSTPTSPRAGAAGTALPAPLHPEGCTPCAALTGRRILLTASRFLSDASQSITGQHQPHLADVL